MPVLPIVAGPILAALRIVLPRTEICTVRVSFWGALVAEIESGTPTEISGTAITKFRFENVNCTLGFDFDVTGEGLGFELTWSANRTEAGYEGAIERDEDGDDLTFVADELLDP